MAEEAEAPAPDASFSVEMLGVDGKKTKVPLVTEDLRVDLQKVLEAQVFVDWVASVDKDPQLFIAEIEVQSVDMFGPRIGFIKFKSRALLNLGGDEGMVEVPGIVFMRGGAVGVLVILECEGEEHTILTYQARVPVGTANLPEIPAGMLDGSGNFKGVAADEIAEECDLIISEEELVDLTELAYQGKWRGMLPSAGGCDEFLRLYMFRREVEREVLTALEGRLTGLREEGERIKLHLVPLQDCWKMTPDAKALSCITLYEKLAAEGRIKRAIRTFPSSVHELERSEHMMRNSSDMELPSPPGAIGRTESIDEEGEAPPGAEGQTKLADTAGDSISNSTDSASTQGTAGSMGRQSSRGSSSSKTSATDFVRGGVVPSDRGSISRSSAGSVASTASRRRGRTGADERRGTKSTLVHKQSQLDEMQVAMESLQARVHELEEENARLRGVANADTIEEGTELETQDSVSSADGTESSGGANAAAK